MGDFLTEEQVKVLKLTHRTIKDKKNWLDNGIHQGPNYGNDDCGYKITHCYPRKDLRSNINRKAVY